MDDIQDRYSLNVIAEGERQFVRNEEFNINIEADRIGVRKYAFGQALEDARKQLKERIEERMDTETDGNELLKLAASLKELQSDNAMEETEFDIEEEEQANLETALRTAILEWVTGEKNTRMRFPLCRGLGIDLSHGNARDTKQELIELIDCMESKELMAIYIPLEKPKKNDPLLMRYQWEIGPLPPADSNIEEELEKERKKNIERTKKYHASKAAKAAKVESGEEEPDEEEQAEPSERAEPLKPSEPKAVPPEQAKHSEPLKQAPTPPIDPKAFTSLSAFSAKALLVAKMVDGLPLNDAERAMVLNLLIAK
jgi:hypothetical protein